MLTIGMILSLLALVAMQWYWLREVGITRQAQFDQAVAEALRQTNYSLEGMEASRLLQQAMDGKKWVKQFDSLAGASLLYAYDTVEVPPPPKKRNNTGTATVFIYSDSLVKGMPLPVPSKVDIQHMQDVVVLQKADSLLQKASALGHSQLSYSYRIEHKADSMLRALSLRDSVVLKQIEKAPIQRVIIRSDYNSSFANTEGHAPATAVVPMNRLKVEKDKAKTIVQRNVPIDSLLAKVLGDFIAPKQPIEKRISQVQFDSILAANLRQSGIQLSYQYWVSREEGDENKLVFGNNRQLPSGVHLYQTRLFPNDLFHQNEQLMLFFIEESSFLGEGMRAMYFLAGMLFLLVAGIFYAAFRYLMHHKRLSEVKSDFINNMSHEFKTPLATINLATDALANDKVKSEPAAIDKYISIIKSENRRMNQHVELILQTARLERKELQLHFAEIDSQHLLEHAIALMEMQFTEKEGSITLEKGCELTFRADETHLIHVITNLLDNALKYCSQKPHVVVQTAYKADWISISFRDNGIGMSKEQIDHIFDQFYRVSSGNIHNVKGFGLGLSYAKAIVQAHGGRLEVKSQIGKGSTFVLQLPLNPQAND